MNTPIVDFVKKYKKSRKSRFHMPGHKGKKRLGFERYDITEIDGADVLYSCSGIIKQSQQNASFLFGSKATLYSTEGSSLAIRAMLFLVCLYAKKNGEKPIVFAARNAHKTFVTTAAVLGIDVKWLFGKEQNYISCNISPDELENAILKAEEKPVAIYITSPDYLGNISNIKGISEVCKKNGIILLVDNAHGAYLNFLSENSHPISLGADMCCDSAHKTLRVLTGGAYLHISKSAPSFFEENAQKAMRIFASTSPSYLILQSLDLENKYLEQKFIKELKILEARIENLKQTLKNLGFSLMGEEKAKITVCTKDYGYYGYEIAYILNKKGLVCEFCDRDFVCFMFGTSNKMRDFRKLEKAFKSLEKRPKIEEEQPKMSKTAREVSLQKAIMMPSEKINTENADGRIAAENFFGCPPAVSIVCAGEKIDQNIQKNLLYYGIKEINVLIL